MVNVTDRHDQCASKRRKHTQRTTTMAIAAGAEEQSQDPQMPTPGPTDPVEEADAASIATSDDSFTTDDDEENAGAGGKQTWTMSFDWQDENDDTAADTFTSFEESTDFGQPSLHFTRVTSSPSARDSNCEAAEPSPADPDHDWVQPWSSSSSNIAPILEQGQSNVRQHTKESQPKPKAEPMTDEHKTAILGAMKNVKMDYIPRWAMQLEERRWLDAMKQKAAAQNSGRAPTEV
ncbi:hypothetical protein ABBQ32_007793 [Trebouxia sp. C0010 RCD-2024]